MIVGGRTYPASFIDTLPLPLSLSLARFCPFRFIHAHKRPDGVGDHDDSPALTETAQPRQLMFGYGKHICPGRELAKLEMIVFFKKFFNTFDYHIVERQVGIVFGSSFTVS